MSKKREAVHFGYPGLFSMVLNHPEMVLEVVLWKYAEY